VLLLAGGVSAQETGKESAPSGKKKGMTVVFNQGRYDQVVQSIENWANVQIDLFGEARNARVDIIAKDALLTDVLDRITDAHEFVWWKVDEGKFAIADFDTYAQMTLREPEFDASLTHVEKTYGCTRTDGPDGTTRLTCAPRPKVVRGGPTPVVASLGGTDTAEAHGEPDPPVTIVFKNAKIEQVVMAAAQQTRKTIRIRGALQGVRVDVLAREVPLARALDKLCANADLVWWETDDGLFGIAKKEFFEANVLGNGRLEKCLDVIGQAHGRSWRKVHTGPEGAVYELKDRAADASTAPESTVTKDKK